jgi:hypothetical protein
MGDDGGFKRHDGAARVKRLAYAVGEGERETH